MKTYLELIHIINLYFLGGSQGRLLNNFNIIFSKEYILLLRCTLQCRSTYQFILTQNHQHYQLRQTLIYQLVTYLSVMLARKFQNIQGHHISSSSTSPPSSLGNQAHSTHPHNNLIYIGSSLFLLNYPNNSLKHNQINIIQLKLHPNHKPQTTILMETTNTSNTHIQHMCISSISFKHSLKFI